MRVIRVISSAKRTSSKFLCSKVKGCPNFYCPHGRLHEHFDECDEQCSINFRAKCIPVYDFDFGRFSYDDLIISYNSYESLYEGPFSNYGRRRIDGAKSSPYYDILRKPPRQVGKNPIMEVSCRSGHGNPWIRTPELDKKVPKGKTLAQAAADYERELNNGFLFGDALVELPRMGLHNESVYRVHVRTSPSAKHYAI